MTSSKHGTPEPPERASEHLTVRPAGDGPAEVRFMFENQEKRTLGAGAASVLAHVAFIVLCVIVSRLVPERVYETYVPPRLSDRIVWLAEPGPGGGGGGGNESPEPPPPAELPGEEPISVPAPPPEPEPTPQPEPQEEPPPIELTIPAQTMAAATTITPGALDATPTVLPTESRGSGTGTGVGPGEGSGLGEGVGGNLGGGVYAPGNGVTSPSVIHEVEPQYTSEAMRAKVQGTVVVECVVLPDGTVGKVEVVRSLDPTFGLDEQAVKAARQWRFRPATRFGEPVAVLVRIELSFNLR